MSIHGFTHRTYVIRSTDVSIMDEFSTINNLTLSDILNNTEMVDKFETNLNFFFFYLLNLFSEMS